MDFSVKTSGEGHWFKGVLVMARMSSEHWKPREVGVVLDTRDVDGCTYVSVIFEKGGYVALRVAEANCDLVHLEGRDASIFMMTYLPMSNWQVEEDFEAGLFQNAFAEARGLIAIGRAQQSAGVVMAREKLMGKRSA